MGLRTSNNIKLINKGTNTVRNIATKATDNKVSKPEENQAFTGFDAETLKQPLGKVGMINRMHSKILPDISSGNATEYYNNLIKNFDFDKIMREKSDRTSITSGYFTNTVSKEAFERFYNSTEKMMFDYQKPSKLRPFTTPNSHKITGFFGKYEIGLECFKDSEGITYVNLGLYDNKIGHRISNLLFMPGKSPSWTNDTTVLKSKADAKIMQVLSWALVENQPVFRALLDLMK